MSDSEGLLAAALGDDRAALLRALRAELASAYVEAAPAYKAAIAKQLRETQAELSSLPDATEVSAADEVAKRRAARRSGAAGSARAHSQG